MVTNVYIVCPVTNATEEQKEKLKKYVENLEVTRKGVNVFYPARDNPFEKTDKIGDKIILENSNAIDKADEIHLFWDKNSKGSYFDLGMAYIANKPLYIINPEDIEPNEGLSWENFICDWAFSSEGFLA